MFSDRLRALRKSEKITQEELASILGVERSTVGKYEGKDDVIPSPAILKKIADHFRVTVDFLLGRTAQPDPMLSPAPAKGVNVPVLGRIAAGIPIEAVQDVLDYEEISPEMAAQGEYFALQIRGNSMEPRIREGDVVIVRRQPDVESGDTAVVIVNGNEATIKRIKKRPDGVMLIPNNPAYEPMFYNNEEIARLPVVLLGKVVELRAKL